MSESLASAQRVEHAEIAAHSSLAILANSPSWPSGSGEPLSRIAKRMINPDAAPS